MVDNEIARRRLLTFEQAEGITPLPSQMTRTVVTAELRAVLWNYIHECLKQTSRGDTYTYVGRKWAAVLSSVHVYRFHLPVDEFDERLSAAIKSTKQIFMAGDYAAIYGWLQFVLQHGAPDDFANRLEKILRYCRSPYRVVDKDVLCPIATESESGAINAALNDLEKSGLVGSRSHLKMAARDLADGNFPDSVRESIHAVESAVRVLEPSADFSKALSKLESRTNIHGALRKGFLALYGYTSDEQGIRHPMLENDAPITDEADAMFMLGACSAFLSYLVNRARSADLIAD